MNDDQQHIEAACCELPVNDEPARAFEALHGIKWTNTAFGVRACWTDAWRLAQAAQREACAAAKVDERHAWHPWPDQQPSANGYYLVLVQPLKELPYIEVRAWEDGGWWMNSNPYGRSGARPLAWRPMPPLPEWAQ